MSRLKWFTARRIALIFGLIVFAWICLQMFGHYYKVSPPAQPIPFSHHIHVTTKNLNCFFCHPNAMRSDHAGLPPVQKCYLCHRVIASNFQPISRVVGYYKRQEPIPWRRVYVLPDFVHFTHQAHVGTRRFDCGICHGNVAQMDRVGLQQKIDMNWCVTCHWRNKGPDNCFVCHY
jgi:hypothetical protein